MMELARAKNCTSAFFRGQAGYFGYAGLLIGPALWLASPFGMINENLGLVAFMAFMYPIKL